MNSFVTTGSKIELQAEDRMRVVLVTGASGAIGRAVAERFARSGDAVVLTARNIDKLKQTFNELIREGVPSENLIFHPLDVTNFSSIAVCVKHVTQEIGDIDVLVHCAGDGPVGTLETVTDE